MLMYGGYWFYERVFIVAMVTSLHHTCDYITTMKATQLSWCRHNATFVCCVARCPALDIPKVARVVALMQTTFLVPVSHIHSRICASVADLFYTFLADAVAIYPA